VVGDMDIELINCIINRSTTIEAIKARNQIIMGPNLSSSDESDGNTEPYERIQQDNRA
jgi:hypothetical protein